MKKETELSVLKEIRDILKAPIVLNKKSDEISNARFTRNADGTVTDKQLSIIWAKEDLSKKMNWEEAKKACKTLGDGWRLPTDKELESLIDRSKYNPAIIAEAAVLNLKTDDWYWTSTPCAWSAGYAWGVDFSSGYVGYSGEDYGSYVRPVRSSQ